MHVSRNFEIYSEMRQPFCVCRTSTTVDFFLFLRLFLLRSFRTRSTVSAHDLSLEHGRAGSIDQFFSTPKGVSFCHFSRGPALEYREMSYVRVKKWQHCSLRLTAADIV